jgi:hypothetical protein
VFEEAIRKHGRMLRLILGKYILQDRHSVGLNIAFETAIKLAKASTYAQALAYDRSLFCVFLERQHLTCSNHVVAFGKLLGASPILAANGTIVGEGYVLAHEI